jgi:ribosomal protein S18 acetylase RimI-like enzyme
MFHKPPYEGFKGRSQVGWEKNTKELSQHSWNGESRFSLEALASKPLNAEFLESFSFPRRSLFLGPTRLKPISFATAGALIEIEQNCFRYPWSLSKMEAVSMQLNTIGSVVEVDQEKVGFAIGSITRSGLKIVSIAVLPSVRRFGLATKLYNELVTFAEKRKAFSQPSERKVITAVVHEENMPAIKFFKQLGFIAAKTLKRECYLSDDRDGIVMELTLRAADRATPNR